MEKGQSHYEEGIQVQAETLSKYACAERLTGIVSVRSVITSGHSKDGSASRDCGISAVQVPSSLLSEQSANQQKRSE